MANLPANEQTPGAGATAFNLHNASEQTLLKKRTYDATFKKWSCWSNVYSRPKNNRGFEYNFGSGGQLCIFAGLIDEDRQKAISDELLLQCPTLFRQYSIQNTNEPRVHFLLHEHATPDFDEHDQPGYRYGVTRMKSHPLKTMPQIQSLALQLQEKSQKLLPEAAVNSPEECFWNVGVNAVLYRDGLDRIGYHADDAQGEELILTVLVSSPVGTTRKVTIRTRHHKKRLQHGDEEFELLLDAGDAYSMDGEMQKHYLHSVPSDRKCVGGGEVGQSVAGEKKRIALVMRRGRTEYVAVDSGTSLAVSSLQPRVKVPYLFGNCIPKLVEGSTYSRLELMDLHAHRSCQKGVSGNRGVGCDAIIVSGLREDGLGHDNLFTLLYACSTKEGALSLLKNSTCEQPIRVFRSSVLKSMFRAICAEQCPPARYRYDGLFRVAKIQFVDRLADGTLGDPHTADASEYLSSKSPITRVFLFQLERLGCGVGDSFNRVLSSTYVEYCVGKKTMAAEALGYVSTPCPLTTLISQARDRVEKLDRPSDVIERKTECICTCSCVCTCEECQCVETLRAIRLSQEENIFATSGMLHLVISGLSVKPVFCEPKDTPTAQASDVVSLETVSCGIGSYSVKARVRAFESNTVTPWERATKSKKPPEHMSTRRTDSVVTRTGMTKLVRRSTRNRTEVLPVIKASPARNRNAKNTRALQNPSPRGRTVTPELLVTVKTKGAAKSKKRERSSSPPPPTKADAAVVSRTKVTQLPRRSARKRTEVLPANKDPRAKKRSQSGRTVTPKLLLTTKLGEQVLERYGQLRCTSKDVKHSGAKRAVKPPTSTRVMPASAAPPKRPPFKRKRGSHSQNKSTTVTPTRSAAPTYRLLTKKKRGLAFRKTSPRVTPSRSAAPTNLRPTRKTGGSAKREATPRRSPRLLLAFEVGVESLPDV